MSEIMHVFRVLLETWTLHITKFLLAHFLAVLTVVYLILNDHSIDLTTNRMLIIHEFLFIF